MASPRFSPSDHTVASAHLTGLQCILVDVVTPAEDLMRQGEGVQDAGEDKESPE